MLKNQDLDMIYLYQYATDFVLNKTLMKNSEFTVSSGIRSTTICRRTRDKWQAKTLFLVIFDRPSSIVCKSVFDCRLSGVIIWLPIIRKVTLEIILGAKSG